MYNLWNNEANNYDSNSRFLARLNITLASHNCSPDSMKKYWQQLPITTVMTE